MGHRGTCPRGGPDRDEGIKGTRAVGGESEGGGLEGAADCPVLEEGLDFLGGAVVSLADDAGLAVDKLGDGDVVVEFLVHALVDGSSHSGNCENDRKSNF